MIAPIFMYFPRARPELFCICYFIYSLEISEKSEVHRDEAHFLVGWRS